jgi:hypothetical protein
MGLMLRVGCDCWHVHKKRVLAIDGKNNSNDGMSTGKNKNNASMLTIIDARTTTTKVWLQERIVATLAGLQLEDNNGKQVGKEDQQ